MRKNRLCNVISFLLTVVLLFNIAVPAMAQENEPTGAAAGADNPLTADYILPPWEEDTEETAEQTKPAVYRDGKILIYHYKQLLLIGSGQDVYDLDYLTNRIGSGQKIEGITYSGDADYEIVQDIPLPRHTQWKLPDGFSGTITGTRSPDAQLYDEETDTIYLYNPLQIAVMADEDSSIEIVMDGDMDVSTFGMGNVITDSDVHSLTYSGKHSYVIAKGFSSDLTNPSVSVNLQNSPSLYDGRDFPGQVVKKIDQDYYILIGNQEQLRKIGSGDDVLSAVYQMKRTGLGDYEKDTDNNGNPIILYGGDADLLEEQNGYADFGFQQINEKTQLGRYYAGVDQTTGDPYNTAAKTSLTQTSTGSWHTEKKYDINEKYIIFRDIDLGGITAPWTPLMFSGTMTGAVAENGEKIWDGDLPNGSNSITATRRAVISNIYVNQTQPIEVNKYIGIGFFATVTNQINANDYGISAGTVKVKNLELNQVEVHNTSTTATQAQTILSALTSGVGGLAGWLLDNLLKVVSFGSIDLSLQDTLSALLNARVNDPTIFSTGAFAGRIVGDVEIDNCSVTGSVTVENHKNNTGGFVGYTNGVTEYSGLSRALGALTNVLESLLNVIPGLGLGDLITILLENALPLGNLIPTGYYEPHINGCTVENLGGTVGQSDTNSNGGFVGLQIGTQIESCAVKNSDNIVNAAIYGGGFSGVARDAEVSGTLDGLGLDLTNPQLLQSLDAIDNFETESLLMECSIEDSTITVNGGGYLGGFAGALAASYSIDCDIKGTVSNPLTVSGTGNSIGGLAGEATIGWLNSIGKNDTSGNNSSLLSVVKQLGTGLLSENSNPNQKLLSLIGLVPSAIMGCHIDTGRVNVFGGGSYIGGIVGRGQGVFLTESSAEYMSKLTYWESGDLSGKTARDNYLTNLESVTAGGDYVGGVAGEVETISMAGVLDGALSAGSFVSFTVSRVTVTGVDEGYTVLSDGTAAGADGDFVAGGFGMGFGGTIDEVHLLKLKKVEAANNKAAGFIGAAGPGDLVSSGGLTINLLGLNNLINVKNLLSIGQAVHVTISDSDVTGIDRGFTVEAKGSGSTNPGYQYLASGFIAQSNSTEIINCHTYRLKWVKASDVQGYSGGFVAVSQTGGLADVSDVDGVKSLLSVEGGILGAISYLIPSYTNCTVNFVDGGYVSADIAGGFAGDMQSGTVDNSTIATVDDTENPQWTKTMPELFDRDAVNATGDLEKQFAVINIDSVRGQTYGGGFAGKLRSGALAGSSGGISILGDVSNISINISELLGVINAYVPFVKHAGVYSQNGFVVAAHEVRLDDPYSGSAGGFVGYASGAQISHSDVYKLKHTEVTPPNDLEGIPGSHYFDNKKSRYAVVGGHYAGGYGGNIDIGDAASVGKGLKILGNSIQLTNVLSALSVVVTTIEHSDVQGAGGGFSVIADGTDSNGKVGMSGGYAGAVYGGHIQNSHCKNFYYIIGQEMSGGYAGNIEPGNVANLLEDTSVLNGLVDIDSSLASLVEDFVPTIRDSTTSCVPCGGAVRAQAASDAGHQRGCAGGFCGHNEGGHIWGLNTDTWKDQNDGIVAGHDFGHNTEGSYTGEQHICTAWRIRSVYGYEYAGGFTGYMESADTASTGNISLLGGLIKLDNLLGALSAVYPTEKNTAVYGPLRNLDVDTWNSWVAHIGIYGSYGDELAVDGTVETQEQLDIKLTKYIYGCHVAAGRTIHDQMVITPGGIAGGYVGYMVSGVISNGQSYDMKHIKAMRSAGGYAGRMKTGGAANFGSASILGLNLNLGQLVQAAQVFVPTIRSGSVYGWQSGMTVTATGTDFIHTCGYAGGYAGSTYGAQIWGDRGVDDGPAFGCNVTNLRYVRGTNAVGGFVGLATAASVADVNTNASDGLLQNILNSLISTPGDLASVMQATVTTIRQTVISPDNAEFGFIVKGTGNAIPQFAGGFAGSLEASVIGSRKGESNIIVNGLRGVYGQYYAGGFVGLADVGSVAAVSSDEGTGGGTSILGLIQAGSVDVLDVFRTYIYYSEVNGVDEGIVVKASTSAGQGILSETRYSGCAGGFGGGVMNGSVKNSKVTNLNTVSGLNYNGGFIGHMGKNGAVDVDKAQIAGPLLAGLNAGVLDIFGTVVDNCEVEGINAGSIISSVGGEQPISGGFTGYGDLSQIKNSRVINLKQVYSDEIAGGFIGKTNMEYLIAAEIDSGLVQIVLQILNILLKILLIPDLENLDLLDTDRLLSLIGVSQIPLGLKLLSDGDLLYVNLLGLKIGVSLVKDQGGNQTGTAIVTIGDSSVALPYDENGFNVDNPEVVVNLLKGNATRVINCSVTGIDIGYDVYGGTASNDADGTNSNGYAGGFVGYNNEGRLLNNEMIYCDVVRGYPGKVGHFSGYSSLQTVYDHTSDELERNNVYHVYRDVGASYQYALTANGTLIGTSSPDTGTGVTYNRFDMVNLASPIARYSDWENAYISTSGSVTGDSMPIGVYESSAKAVLMLDTPTGDNPQSLIPEPAQMQDPCKSGITVVKTDANGNKLSDAVFDLYYQDTVIPPAYTFNEVVIPPAKTVTVTVNGTKPSHPGLEDTTTTTTVTTYSYEYPSEPSLPSAEEADWILPRSDNDYIYFRDYNVGSPADHDYKSFANPGGSGNSSAAQDANRSWLRTDLKDNVETQHLEIDYDHRYWYAAQFSGSGKQDVQYAVWERFVDRYNGQDTVVWKIQPPDGYDYVRFCLYDGGQCIRTTEKIKFKLGQIWHKKDWGGMYKNENGSHCYFNVPLQKESDWAFYDGLPNDKRMDTWSDTTTMQQAIRYTPTEQKITFHCNSNQVWHNIHIEFFRDVEDGEAADITIDGIGYMYVGQHFPGFMMEPYAYAGDNYRVGNYLTYELTIPQEAKYFRVNNGIDNSMNKGTFTATSSSNPAQSPYAYRSAVRQLKGSEENGRKNYDNYYSFGSSAVNVSNSTASVLHTWNGTPSSDNRSKTYSDKPVDSDYDYIYFEAPSSWGNHIYAYFYGGGDLRNDNWQRAVYSIWPGVAATATEYTASGYERGTSDIYDYSLPVNPESTYTDKAGRTVYKFRVPKGERKNYSKVIFNNGLKSQLSGNGGDGKLHETGVITFHRGYLYTSSGSSKLHNEVTSTTSYEQRGDYLYIKNTAGWDDIHIRFYNSSGSQILQTGEGYVMDYSGKQDGTEYFRIAIPKNAAKFSLSTGKQYSDDGNTSIQTRKTTGKYDILRYAPTETDTNKSDYTKGNMVFDLTGSGTTGTLTKTYPDLVQTEHTETYSSTETAPSLDSISNSPRGDYIYIKDTANVMANTTPTFSFKDAGGVALTSPVVLKLDKDSSNHRWYRVGIPTNAASFTINGGSDNNVVYPKSTSSTQQMNVTPGDMYFETVTNTTLELLWPKFTSNADDLSDEIFEDEDGTHPDGQRGDNLYLVHAESDLSDWTGMKVTFYDSSGMPMENSNGDMSIRAKSLGLLTAPPTGQPLIDGTTTDNADAQGYWYRVAIPYGAATFTVSNADGTITTPKAEIFEKRDKISRYRKDYTLGDMQYRLNCASTKLIYPIFTEVENQTLEISQGQTIGSESSLTRVDASQVSDYADNNAATATTQSDTLSTLPVLHETDTNTITYEWGGGNPNYDYVRFDLGSLANASTYWGQGDSKVYAVFYNNYSEDFRNSSSSRTLMEKVGSTNVWRIVIPTDGNGDALYRYVRFYHHTYTGAANETQEIDLNKYGEGGFGYMFYGHQSQNSNNNRKFDVSEPTSETGESDNKLRFDNSTVGWAKVYAYFMDNSNSAVYVSYPGIEMHDDGDGIFSLDMTSYPLATKVKFHNNKYSVTGSDSSEDGTNDLTLPGTNGKGYLFNVNANSSYFYTQYNDWWTDNDSVFAIYNNSGNTTSAGVNGNDVNINSGRGRMYGNIQNSYTTVKLVYERDGSNPYKTSESKTLDAYNNRGRGRAYKINSDGSWTYLGFARHSGANVTIINQSNCWSEYAPIIWPVQSNTGGSNSATYQPEDRYGYINAVTDANDRTYKNAGGGTYRTSDDNYIVIQTASGTTLTDPYIMFYSDDNATTPVGGSDMESNGISLVKAKITGDSSTDDNTSPYKIRLPKDARWFRIGNGASGTQGNAVPLYENVTVRSADGTIYAVPGDNPEPYVTLTGYHHAGTTFTVGNDGNVTAKTLRTGKTVPTQTITDPLYPRTDNDYIFLTDVGNHFASGNAVYAYYYGGEDGEYTPWPGIRASTGDNAPLVYTDNDGNKVYMFQLPKVSDGKYPYVIFNNGSASDGTRKISQKIDIMEASTNQGVTSYSYIAGGMNYRVDASGNTGAQHYGTYDSAASSSNYVTAYPTASGVKEAVTTEYYSSNKQIFIIGNGTNKLDGTTSRDMLDDMHIIFYADDKKTIVGGGDSGYKPDKLMSNSTTPVSYADGEGAAGAGEVYRISVPADAMYFQITNGTKAGTTNQYMRQSELKAVTGNGLYRFVPSAGSAAAYIEEDDASGNINEKHFLLDLVNKIVDDAEDIPTSEIYDTKLATVVTGADGKQEKIIWLKLTADGTQVDQRYLDHTTDDIWQQEGDAKITTIRLMVATDKCYWKEASAPPGYKLQKEKIMITSLITTVIDEPLPQQIVLKKTAKEKVGTKDIGVVLAGAEFRLFSVTDAENGTLGDAVTLVKLKNKYEYEYKPIDANLLAEMTASGDYETTGSGSSAVLTEYNTLVTGANGKLKVDNLPWGDYCLEEVQAPSGYSNIDSNTGSNKRVYFSVGQNTVIKNITCSDEMAPAYIKLYEHINEKRDAWGDPTFIFKIKQTGYYDYSGETPVITNHNGKEILVALTVDDEGKWTAGLTSHSYPSYNYKDWYQESTDELENGGLEYLGQFQIDEQGRIRLEPGKYEITRMPVSRYEFVENTYTMDNISDQAQDYIDNRTETEKLTVTIPAERTAIVHYYDKVGYYDKISQADEEINNFYTLDENTRANKTVKGIRIADYHQVGTTGTGADTNASDTMTVPAENLKIYKIMSDGSEVAMTSEEKAALTNFDITYTYDSATGDKREFGGRAASGDDQAVPAQFSYADNTITVTDASAFENGVYTLNANYNGFKATFDIVFLRSST